MTDKHDFKAALELAINDIDDEAISAAEYYHKHCFTIEYALRAALEREDVTVPEFGEYVELDYFQDYTESGLDLSIDFPDIFKAAQFVADNAGKQVAKKPENVSCQNVSNIPEGYALVPIDPTEHMIEVGCKHYNHDHLHADTLGYDAPFDSIEEAYKAMIVAAQYPLVDRAGDNAFSARDRVLSFIWGARNSDGSFHIGLDFLDDVEKALDCPTLAVERVEGLADAILIKELPDYEDVINAERQFIKKYGRTFESVINDAARLQLARQEGE